MITYAHPFNERIRTLLRLEELFRRFERFVARTETLDHHIALTTLFEILEVSARADVKSETRAAVKKGETPGAGEAGVKVKAEGKSDKARADVKAETRAANKKGELTPAGEAVPAKK